jgi:hypothetical protein
MKTKTKKQLFRRLLAILLILASGSASAYALYAYHGRTIPVITTPVKKNTISIVKTTVLATPKVTTPTPTKAVTPVVVPTTPTPIVTVVTPPVVATSPGSTVNTLTPASSSAPSQSGSSSQAPASTPAYTSTNWSGYLSTGSVYTAITGAWTIPTVTGNNTNTSGDGTWIGIGGVNTSDLIQIGTDNTVSASGQVTSNAFYETLPAAAQTIVSLVISPGDAMVASVTETSTSQWTISLEDTTNGESFSDNLTYTSTNSSAEWIEEDPSFLSGAQVPFDNFGAVSFTGASSIDSGMNTTLTVGNAQSILLVDSDNNALATPSVIGSDGESFSVTRNN